MSVKPAILNDMKTRFDKARRHDYPDGHATYKMVGIIGELLFWYIGMRIREYEAQVDLRDNSDSITGSEG